MVCLFSMLLSVGFPVAWFSLCLSKYNSLVGLLLWCYRFGWVWGLVFAMLVDLVLPLDCLDASWDDGFCSMGFW